MRILDWCGAILLLSLTARSQCTNPWQAATPVPGTNGSVFASVTWDPDGAGPLPLCLVLGGQFTTAGSVAVSNIAMWNSASATWSGLGGGVNGPVSALAVLPDGRLAVGGSFGLAGGVAATCIATWNGTSWASVGGGTNGQVYSMLVMANGDLVVGGVFQVAGSAASPWIARWNGTAWSPIGYGPYGGVYALVQMPNGDLIAAGSFWERVMRWNGSAWSSLSYSYNPVYSLAVLPNGDLLTGGYDGVKRWNGLTWSVLGSLQHVQVVRILPNGELVAGGLISPWLYGPAHGVVRWNGTAWVAIGGGVYREYGYPNVNTMTVLPSGELLVAGGFDHAGSFGAADNVATWDGNDWWPIGRVLNGDVQALATLPNGDLLCGGSFTAAGGVAAYGVARWDGSSWSALGGGTNGPVRAVLGLPNGDIVVGGAFVSAGGAPANRLALWNGAQWTALGTGFDGVVHALARLPNGDLVAGGEFAMAGGVPASKVARWNGVAWAPLGAGMQSAPGGGVYSLLPLANGDLIAGGSFTTAGGMPSSQVARWNGSAWSALGSGMSQGTYDGVLALALDRQGDLVASGTFTAAGGIPANNIAKWNGTAWSSLGSGPAAVTSITALQTLPGGDLLAGGRSNTGSGYMRFLGRWDGTSWNSIATGAGPSVSAIARRPNDDLVVGLSFARWGSGGGGHPMLATLSTTCPAQSVAIGPGCVGAGSGQHLAAMSPPWSGTTFRARATGLAPNALAVAVYSFQQTSIPMPSVHAFGTPGCTLRVDDEVLYSFPVVGGAVETAVTIPALGILIGATFYHQVVPVELGAAFDIVAVSTTDALALTIGAF